MLRIGAVTVGKSGRIAAQFPIPAQVLAYVANASFDQIDVSLTADAAYKAEVAQAKKQKRLPRYTGTDILRGKITGPALDDAARRISAPRSLACRARTLLASICCQSAEQLAGVHDPCGSRRSFTARSTSSPVLPTSASM